MVETIKTQDELNKLLQQAKKKSSWDEKVKLKLNIRIDKPIGDISLESWKKIKHKYPYWDGLISQISQSNKLFNSDWKFVDKEKLEKFKEYVDLRLYPTLEIRGRGTVKIEKVNENDVITTSWNKLREMFRESRKIFGRDDLESFQSDNALRFLQSIISDEFLQTIEYQAGEEFKLSELREFFAQGWLNEEYPKGVKKEALEEINKFFEESESKKTSEVVIFTVPLKEIPSKYWEKVEVSDDWDKEYVEAENDTSHGGWEGSRAVPMTFSHGVDGVRCSSTNLSAGWGPWYRKFKSQELLDNYKKYVDVDREIKHYFDSIDSKSTAFVVRGLSVDTWFTTHLPTQLTKLLREGNKLFIKDGYGKVTSPEAFKFLQSIIELQEIKAKVKLEKDEVVDLKEWTATNLDISNKGLEGKLDLENFPNLRILNCKSNQLTCLDFKKCLRIEKVCCSGNKLVDINFSGENSLEYFDARGNYFSNKHVETLWNDLKKFEKLKTLRIGNKEKLYIKENKSEKEPTLVESNDLKKLVLENCFYASPFILDLGNYPNLENLVCINSNLKNFSSLEKAERLKKLSVESCTFLGGNLILLSKLNNNLEELDITNTDFIEGLEHLPESCKRVICNSDYRCKSIEIVKELNKSKCLRGESSNKYYDLDTWRTDKANNITASVTPLERLFTIRIGIKKFLGEWGKKDDNVPSKLSQLESPEEFNKFRYVSIGKWASRATSVGGGILALTNQPIVGGIVAASSPFVEAISSYIEDNWYLAEETKWKEFVVDTETLLDSYDELLEILKPIKVGKWGKVNLELENLKEKSYRFLEKYDLDKDREISANELDEARKEMMKELRENWIKKEKELKEIMEAIRILSEVVNNYKGGELTGKDKTKVEEEKAELKNKSVSESETEPKEDELIIRLKEAEINYQNIKEGLEAKKKQASPNNEEAIELEKKLIEAKKVLLKYQIKERVINIRNTNWLAKFSQGIKRGWIATYEYTKGGAVNAKVYLVAPFYYWEAFWDNERNQPSEEEKEVQSWWQKLCCDRNKDKNEPSLRESLSLDNDIKAKELQEFTENQVGKNQEETHHAIDLDKHFEEKDTELITHQEIPPKQ